MFSARLADGVMDVAAILMLAIVSAVVGCAEGVDGPDESANLRFTSTPVTQVYHNDPYAYSVAAEGVGGGRLTLEALQLPRWLSFDTSAHVLSGTATGDNLGSFPVRLSVSDGSQTVYQSFSVRVDLRQVFSGSWIGPFPYAWAHDGRPMVGDCCDLYSDASGEDVKYAMWERASAAFAEIKGLMNIASEVVFTYPAGRSKVDVYANRFNTEYYGGWAYHGGAIVLAYDHPRYLPDAEWCANEVEHEMMHVIETLIEGSALLGTDVWFREGIADYYAGSDLITSVEDLDAWLATRRTLPGGGNPIKIHLWEDFPEEVEAVNGQGLWYPMFELAVRYLMDGAGLDRSYDDVKTLFFAVADNGQPFSEALETHFGITLAEFEERFFELITPFLDSGTSSP